MIISIVYIKKYYRTLEIRLSSIAVDENEIVAFAFFKSLFILNLKKLEIYIFLTKYF